MEQIISQKQLIQYLSDLRETLQNFDYSNVSNVIFMDTRSFYCYLSHLKCCGQQTVENVLRKIEKCIPFALTDQSFSLFLSACGQTEVEKMEALRLGFVESCKADFLIMLLGISDASQWKDICNTCESLRKKTYV